MEVLRRSVRALGVLAAAAVGCCLVAAGLRACGAAPPARRDQPSEARLREVAEGGRPVVEAIHRFRQERGLWPSDLDDLSPDYLPAGAARGWRFDWRPVGWWQVTNFAGYPHWGVRYGYGGNDKGWVVTDGIYSSPLKTKQPAPTPSGLSAAQVLKNTKEEFARRVGRHPGEIVHRQGHVAFLYKRKRFEEARGVCEACLKRWPDHWWPNVMLARLDAERGKADQAERRLREWVGKHDDFTHRYFVAEFLLRSGQPKKARAALLEASKYPLAVLHAVNDAGEVLGIGATYFAWLGSMLAYNEGWHDAALAVCDRWQEYCRDNVADSGYLAVRAVCRLARGEHGKAAECLALTQKERGSNYSWTWNLHRLEKAVWAKSKSFRYEPEGLPALPLLIEYE